MGISESNEMITYSAGVLIFSGRPDPIWVVSKDTAERLTELWRALPPLSVKEPVPPPLGYRGCFLLSSDGKRWNAFGGVVTGKLRGTSESRWDKERTFEKILLKSAPSSEFSEYLE
jgi:hypothetical protein